MEISDIEKLKDRSIIFANMNPYISFHKENLFFILIKSYEEIFFRKNTLLLFVILLVIALVLVILKNINYKNGSLFLRFLSHNHCVGEMAEWLKV